MGTRMIEQDRSTVDRAWRLSTQIGKTTLRFGLDLTGSAVKSFIVLLPEREHIKDRLRKGHVLHKARIGVDAIEDGTKRDIDAVRDVGEATLAKAVTDAAADKTVPDNVTQEVVDMAVEQGIDPYANPLVDDATAGRFHAAMKEFGPPPRVKTPL